MKRVSLITLLSLSAGIACLFGKPLIYPLPQEMRVASGAFDLSADTPIVLPLDASEADEFLAEWLRRDLIDQHELPLPISREAKLPGGRKFVLMGDLANPLVKQYCEDRGLLASLAALGNEGYILSVTDDSIVVAGQSKQGALFGLQSLRQIIAGRDRRVSVPQLQVEDAPQFEFRGIRLHLPGRENITYFKRFVKDFVAFYKFNKLIIECNAHMRLERRPELNIGAVNFARHLNSRRLNRPWGPNEEMQTSSHHACADGQVLEKEEVRDLVDYIKRFHIEVIPELPSLTHAYYLLFGNQHLAESGHYEYPDTYCPLNPGSYEVYFDVLAEYIEVIQPSMIHIGHDEWRMEMHVCPRCRGQDYGQLFADDVTKIHQHLAAKGIKTAMWGDHLLEAIHGKGHQQRKTRTGYQYKAPAGLRPEQVRASIPKDILVFNWSWSKGIGIDEAYAEFGFRQVYGNFRPVIDNWDRRIATPGLAGGVASAWTAARELNDGKDLLFDFLGTANLLWSKHPLSAKPLTFVVEPLVPQIRSRLSGRVLPSEAGSKVTPVELTAHVNSSLEKGLDRINVADLAPGRVGAGTKWFALSAASPGGKRALSVYTAKGETLPAAVSGIPINKDVDSLLFLHASARETVNDKGYRLIHNPIETASLLGWYEIVYEDGLVETVPVRYGLNILDWRWRKRVMEEKEDGNDPELSRARYVDRNQNRYAYQAAAVECSAEVSAPITFFAFEWENKRPGVPVREVNLKAATYNGKNENAIMLLAVSAASTVAGEGGVIVE